MTILDHLSVDVPARGISDADLQFAQLAGIDAWHRWRRTQQVALETELNATGLSREDRLDLTRRLAHLEATRAALLAWADEAQSPEFEASRRDRRPRAVLAHRNEWLRNKVALALGERGVQVIASVDDGAAALAVLVCEQPEMLLVEDLLPQIPGHEVVLHAREFAPRTVVGVHAASTQWMGRLLDAGASAWFSRRIPPVDIAGRLTGALRSPSSDVALP